MGGLLAIGGIALACALPSGARDGAGAPALPARVEVLEGRARVARPDGVLNLSAGAPVQRFAEALHFEQAPESRSRIGWSAAASLLVEGRTVLEWAPPDADGDPLSWTFAEVGSASLEVRRGRVRVELAGGWRAALQPGAYTVRGLSGGSVEFHHAAGLPVTLWPPAAKGETLPPFTVLPGAAVRLLGEARRPLALPGAAGEIREPHAKLGFEARSQAASFPSWREFTWPWQGSTKLEVAASGTQPSHDISQVGSQAQSGAPTGSLPVQPASPEVGVELAPVERPGLGPAVPAGDAAPAAPLESRPTDVVADGQARASTDSTSSPAPAARVWRELRRKGWLVLSPYGPRWSEPAPVSAPPAPPNAQQP